MFPLSFKPHCILIAQNRGNLQEIFYSFYYISLVFRGLSLLISNGNSIQTLDDVVKLVIQYQDSVSFVCRRIHLDRMEAKYHSQKCHAQTHLISVVG